MSNVSNVDTKSAEFNSCANLLDDEKYAEGRAKYQDLLKNGKNPFEYIMNMQKDLQIALSELVPGNKDPNTLSKLGDIYDWIRDNKIAFDDEYRELIDALPGMNLSPKERSAMWKKWKAKHNELREKKLTDLDNNELKELKFEFIDTLHFYMNMAIALQISAEEIFVYYYFKNAENHRRYENKY